MLAFFMVPAAVGFTVWISWTVLRAGLDFPEVVSSARVVPITFLVAAMVVPFACAGTAIGAVYARNVRPRVCRFTMMGGASAAFALPWLLAPNAPATWSAGLAAAVAVGCVIQGTAAYGGWRIGAWSLERSENETDVGGC